MSYLSRRMREEGFWSGRRPSDLVVTIDLDLPEWFDRLGLRLDPWQERWAQAFYADPDAVRRMVDPPPLRRGPVWPPLLVTTTPGEPSVLAKLAAKVREAGSQTSPAWEWPDEELEYWPRQNGKSARFNREYIGIWPTRREEGR